MAPPVPIPNTEVKHGSGDDTLLGKVASRQNQVFNEKIKKTGDFKSTVFLGVV